MGFFSQASSGFLSRPKGTQVLAQSCWAPSTKYGPGRASIQHRVPENLLNMSAQNSYVETLLPKVMVFGGGEGNQIQGCSPQDGMRALIRRDDLSLSLSHVRIG